jgi:hypothetical protein
LASNCLKSHEKILHKCVSWIISFREARYVSRHL